MKKRMESRKTEIPRKKDSDKTEKLKGHKEKAKDAAKEKRKEAENNDK